MTGESLEIKKQATETIFSGSIVTKGEATGAVTQTGANTNYGKTIELVKTASPKSHINEIIAKVTKWLLLIVGTLLSMTIIVALLKGNNIVDILPTILVLLLGAIPVALTAMFTVCMALGSKELVKQDVLITRLNAPDDAASMDILCVDKTGTHIRQFSNQLLGRFKKIYELHPYQSPMIVKQNPSIEGPYPIASSA